MSGRRQKQPSLLEHTFAMKVAYGMPQRDAYLEVFGGDPKTPREFNAVDSRASRLAARDDIAALIVDEQKLKGQRISAKERELAEKIRQNIGEEVLKEQTKGNTLHPVVLKGAELFLKSTGQYAPEEHILKNGGMAEGALVPKGVESMDEVALKEIIERGEAIDVESKEVAQDDNRDAGEG